MYKQNHLHRVGRHGGWEQGKGGNGCFSEQAFFIDEWWKKNSEYWASTLTSTLTFFDTRNTKFMIKFVHSCLPAKYFTEQDRYWIHIFHRVPFKVQQSYFKN